MARIVQEYVYKFRPYFRDIIIDLQESDTWKIQLTSGVNFISSKDAEEALKEQQYKIYI